jgi:uncharacterized damage-inducible protein DinB
MDDQASACVGDIAHPLSLEAAPIASVPRMLPYEPTPKTGDEKTMLVAFLDQNRAIMLWKLDGLDEEQARRQILPSATSMLGLVKHLAWVERWWFVDYIGGGEPDYPWSDEDPDADWRIEDHETIASISQLYVDAVGEANAVIEAAENLEVAGTKTEEPRSLRWVLIHMIEETTRHAGHADIVREMIDGTAGYFPGD